MGEGKEFVKLRDGGVKFPFVLSLSKQNGIEDVALRQPQVERCIGEFSGN